MTIPDSVKGQQMPPAVAPALPEVTKTAKITSVIDIPFKEDEDPNSIGEEEMQRRINNV